MSREKIFSAIESLIRTVRSSDNKASQKLRFLLTKAADDLPPDHNSNEMASALEAEYEIFLASATLYGDDDPALNEQRGRLLARFAKLRAWFLIVENRATEQT